MSDEDIFRKFKAGYSVQGIADEAGVHYSEIEMRLRALMVGYDLAANALRPQCENHDA